MRKSSVSLGIRICALVIGLWLIFAGVLTWAVAQDFQNDIFQSAQLLVRDQDRSNFIMDVSDDTPGYGSLMQIMHLGDPYLWLRTEPLLPIILDQLPDSIGSDDWYYRKWELLYGFQAVTVFYDAATCQPLVKSGNLLSLCYITEDAWKNNNTEHQGITYIDLDKLPQGTDIPGMWMWQSPQATFPGSLGINVIRATGYFDGDEFIPVSIDTTVDSFSEEPYGYLSGISHLDGQGAVRWENLYAQEITEDRPLVTIYSMEKGGYSFEHKPVRWNGKNYSSLVELAEEINVSAYEDGNLVENVFSLVGEAAEETGADYFVLVVHAKPLRYAFLRVLPLLIVGSVIITICLWQLLSCIQKNLEHPLANLSRNVEKGSPVVANSGWLEVRQVEQHMEQAQNQIRALQNDVQQLNASLDYAKHAEENRRQLVSNIAHELKTPLAVIHGYAEGLQAGIAEEKRDYYLGTILEEAEKMDAMVLEMLDLSRLEAGKVRLRTDHFSLRKMTQDILNKLAPEESRSQSISFRATNDCMITADEGRIAQVVTNLVSNALRYTPQDGCIWLQVSTTEGTVHFHITNHAEHLSKDGLEKIFDSFYRADASRSDKGTGLGLPIARSIIQLHRGTLTARNVWVNGKPCLEFAFEIPLK